mgnify:CR=1 FL=1
MGKIAEELSDLVVVTSDNPRCEEPEAIIKDILAFSNSSYEGDSYIIVGVSETKSNDELTKIALTSADRKRLNTDANYIYLPAKWNAPDGMEIDSQKVDSIKLISNKDITKEELLPLIISFDTFGDTFKTIQKNLKKKV